MAFSSQGQCRVPRGCKHSRHNPDTDLKNYFSSSGQRKPEQGRNSSHMIESIAQRSVRTAGCAVTNPEPQSLDPPGVVSCDASKAPAVPA